MNTDAEGHVRRLTGDETVSMNMWGFTSRVFGQFARRISAIPSSCMRTDLKAECYIPSTVNDLIEARKARVRVLRTRDSWFGVTYREDRSTAVESIRRLIEAGHYPRRLWS